MAPEKPSTKSSGGGGGGGGDGGRRSSKSKGRRLSKKRPKDYDTSPSSSPAFATLAPRSASMEVPDRFRDGDDAQEDVCAPKDRSAQYMGQSVFAMMAAAGSTTDFRSRFDDGSSSGSDADGDVDGDAGGDIDQGEEKKEGARQKESGRDGRRRVKSKDATRRKKEPTEKGDHDDADDDGEREVVGPRDRMRRQRKRLSERSLLKSLPKLRIKSSRGRTRNQGAENVSDAKGVASQSFPASSSSSSSEEEAEGVRSDAPMMSRVLQAQAQMNASRSPSAGHSAKESDVVIRSTKASTLSQRLKEIFDFDDLEDVISGNC